MAVQAVRTVAVIEARMASTRLPGKVLAIVAGRSLLAHMIERLKRCEQLDGIVVATTGSSADDPIAWTAQDMGVGWYRGSEDDVLERVLEAARANGVDVIVELTADCPLIDPAIVDRTVSRYHAVRPDFCWNVGYPDGMNVRVFSTDQLAKVDELTDDPVDREHVSLHFWEHPDDYTIETVNAPAIHQDSIALTVDEPADLVLVGLLIERLHSQFPQFGLSEILLALNYWPHMRDINRRVARKPVRTTERTV